jgi:tetratricopeptide (TPR) repeat protein/tRNA A-37 threonylcarbamoyl transferase component Bud32
MGIVLLAEQESLGRRVALKLVRPDRLYSPKVRQRFRREIEVVSRLAHPGIVPVYGAGEERSIPYFVMEYVEGTALDRVLHAMSQPDRQDVVGSDLQRAVAEGMRENFEQHAEGSASPVFEGTWSEACMRIIRQVAEALEHAHRRGVLHRDVKPSNIVVTPSGRAMLLDFGLALKDGEERMTRTGAEIGSIPYMAPERLGHEGESGVREDVYALGVLLYECLALRLPYEGKSSVEILQRMQAGVAPPLRRFAPTVPVDCETVCLVAMDHDPARRYATAEAFGRDLTHILEGRPIEARRASFARRSMQWCQRNPAAAVAWGLGVLILVGGPLVYGEQQRAARERIEGINTTLEEANFRIEEQNTTLQGANARIEEQNATLQKANDQIELQNTELVEALSDAEQQRTRATRHFGMAVGSIRFLTDVAIEDLIDVPQAGEAKRKMLTGALAFFSQFLEEAKEGDLESRALRIEVARAHQLTGDIQLHLGESGVGEERLMSAVESYAALVEEKGTLELRRLYAEALGDLGRMHILKGRMAEGQARVDQAIDLFNLCLEEDPEHRDVLFGLQEAIAAEASRMADQGQLKSALEGYLESVAILDGVISGETGFEAERFTRVRTRNRLGETYRSAGQLPEAAEVFALALKEIDELLASSPARLDFRSERLAALSNSGNSATAAGQLDDAQAFFELAIEIGEQLIVEFPAYDNNYHLLAVTCINLGGLFAMQGDERSQGVVLQAEELLLDLMERNPSVTRYSLKLAGAQANLGFGHLGKGEHTAALEYLEQSHARVRDVLEKISGDADALETFMLTAIGLGYAYEGTKEFEEMVDAVEVLLDSALDPQRLMRAASMTCDLADEIDKREDLEADRKIELRERLLDCAEELVHIAFERISNPAPIQQALKAPAFAPLRARPTIAERLGE